MPAKNIVGRVRAHLHVAQCQSAGVVSLLVTLQIASPSFAQSAQSSETAVAQRPAYSLDRSEENWRILESPSRRADLWDPLKYVSLGQADRYLTLAGDFRSCFERYRNYYWGAGPEDRNGYYLQRFMGSADLHAGNRTRVFVEFRSGEIFGRNGGPRPSQDQDTLDISQAFAGVILVRGQDEPRLELKLGRQELNYGEGSLIAIRDMNVRRTFDGARAIVRAGAWKADVLAFRPALIKQGVFDDGIDSSQALWGAWAARRIKKQSFWTQADIYYLGLHRNEAAFEQGKARELRHTVGILLHAQQGAFRMFSEADFQFGSFGKGDIRAWKYAQSLSWSFVDRPLRPVVSLLGAISSGDTNVASPTLQTFNPLFPRGLYYGYIDSTGSPNATVLHPEISVTISPTLSIVARHFSFWRTSTADGIYAQPGFLLRVGGKDQSRYVGSLQDLAIRWRADRHTTFEALASYYEAGGFLRDSFSATTNLFYFSLRTNYRF